MAPAIPDSDEIRCGDELVASAREGDWNGIQSALDRLASLPFPRNSAGLHDRARMLEEALNAAKAIRADLAASQVRLSAAARFAESQDSAESANS